jgi:glycosyltransferase involved in cell wall biosynthesis
LAYLTNARLPTEKAHGYQICKMCEAFPRHDAEVVLLHPFRRQPDPRLTAQTVFDYYDVRPVFEVQTLANVDIIRFERWGAGSLFAGVFFTHALLWGRYAARQARREKADVYFTRNSEIAYWLVRMGLPTVYEAHVAPRGGQRWLLQQIARRPALRLTVGITSFIRDRLVSLGVPAERIIVLPDGVDMTSFAGLPGQEECRRRLGLPLDRPVIGYIGRFQTLGEEKGIPELVQTMAAFSPQDDKDPLLLCVGGPMEAVPGYLDLARRHGVTWEKLRFVDRVPNRDVPLWIRACDLVTIPWPWTEFSAYFTSPLKLFEYMAAAAPIVATDLPSLREVLRHGENAWLVKPGNAQALAAGLQHLLNDASLRGRLATRARQDVLNYSWSQRAATVLRSLN